MEEISLQQDHQYKHHVLQHLLDAEERKFLFALHKVLNFNMNLLRHFEKQSQYQVIFFLTSPSFQKPVPFQSS